jgi:hypothetical protein
VYDLNPLWMMPLRDYMVEDAFANEPARHSELPTTSRRAGSAAFGAPTASAAVSTRCVDGVPKGGQALRHCQVPGCVSPGAEPRSYLGRCRLCLLHMRAETVDLGGTLLRFCQKYVCILTYFF